MYYTIGDDIFHEVSQVKNGKKINIYLKKVQGGFVEECKCFGTHLLEQVFDENNDLISEVIKENPHHTDIDFSLIEDDCD